MSTMSHQTRLQLFEETYTKVERRCRFLSRRYFRDEFDREDALQTLYTKLFFNFDRFDARRGAKIETWVFSVAKNHFIEEIRKRNSRNSRFLLFSRDFIDEVFDIAANGDGEIEREPLAKEISEAIESLDGVNEKEAIRLHYFKGLRGEAVAESLGTSYQAIRKTLSRARGKLAKKLGERYESYRKESRQ